MKKIWGLLFLLILKNAYSQIDVKKEFEFAALQYSGMLKSHLDTKYFPESSNPDGTQLDMPSNWWTPGFFPGSLWLLYEYTKDAKWKVAAEEWTLAIKNEQFNTSTHDLGFMIYCAFGNGFRLTKNKEYKKIMLNGATSLSSRFNPKVGLIKSWDIFQNKYSYPVIIDNMMNLEYLFWAARESGNRKFYDICVKHADNTLKNHFRADNSSYHVICYGSNGEVLAKKTSQGANDESSWSRGQAWGLYGFTIMFRETKDQKYLIQAQKIADYIINNPNLPVNKIPYWDFSKPGEERDASAAAIIASALLELSQYCDKELNNQYLNTATKILETLSGSDYKSKLGKNNNFILMHSTGNKPGNTELDVPLIYADYYYLEALLRYQKAKKK